MNSFVQSKRPQFIILLGLIIIYLLVNVVTHIVFSIKFVEFAFITVAFGFAPAYYFRYIFKYKDLVGWILHAGTLGLIFIPFLFLFWGWLGVNIIFEYSILILYLGAALGVLSLFFEKSKNIGIFLRVQKIKPSDLIIALVFLVFTFVLTLQNLHVINIHWDSFTYWGLDAKYLFENNQLRTYTIHSDLIIFRYTSFHPIYHFIVYKLYGGIFEQFAAWVNVYVNFLAMFLLYWYVREKSAVHRYLLSASILLVSYTAISIVYMLSMHADTMSSFFVLVFFLILTNRSETAIEKYGYRSFILLLVSISFYFIKSPFLYFTVILIGIYLVYDSKYLMQNRKKLLSQKSFLLSISIIAVLMLMRFIYFVNIGGSSTVEKNLSSFKPNILVLQIRSMLAYLVDLSQYLIEATPYILGLWWLTLLSIFIVKPLKKNYLYLFFSAVSFFLIPIVTYAAEQRSFQSESLPRYSAIPMYLFPLVFSFISFVENKFRKMVSYGIFGVVTIFVFLNILTPMPLIESFQAAGGTYKTELTKYHNFAESILEITDEGARILIADNVPVNNISNRGIPAIFIRYYLIYNSVGGQYTISVGDLDEFVVQNNVDYILLLSPDEEFEDCKQELTPDRDYLIDLRTGQFGTKVGNCIFSDFEVIELGKAIR